VYSEYLALLVCNDSSRAWRCDQSGGEFQEGNWNSDSAQIVNTKRVHTRLHQEAGGAFITNDNNSTAVNSENRIEKVSNVVTYYRYQGREFSEAPAGLTKQPPAPSTLAVNSATCSIMLVSQSIMSSLSGKVAIVTGAARGIGASIAISLAKEGANVVVNYVSPSSKPLAEKVAQEAQSYGPKALVVQANVGSLSDIDKLVKQTVSQFGRIDILVNNGGVVDFANIGDITPESFTRILSSLIWEKAVASSTYRALQLVKAAVESITRVMGTELRDKGIRVNAINPGPVVTDMFTSLPDELQDHFRATHPVAQPADIADAVLFLAGPNSRWINGGTLNTNNAAIFN
ncbi:3660_t:CDS:2, partial [Acaulospora colombiana]